MKKLVFYFCLILVLMSNFSFGQAVYKSLGGNWNTALSWTLESGIDGDLNGIPDSDDDVIIDGNNINQNVNASCKSLVIKNGGILNFNTNSISLNVLNDVTIENNSSIVGNATSRSLNINGNFNIANSSVATITGINLSVIGNNFIDGSLIFNSNVGVKTFENELNINGSGSLNSTGITTAGNLIFKNGISNSGSGFNASSATFNTNSQILNGTTDYNFSGILNVTGINLTNNSTINLTSGGTGIIIGTGTWIQGSNSILNTSSSTLTISSFDASSNVNLVNYNRNNTQTIFATTYYNLKIDVANTKTLGGNIIVNNDLTVNIASLASSNFTMTVLGNTLVTGDGNINTTNIVGIFNLQALTLNTGRVICSANGIVNMTSLATNSTGNTIGAGNINNSGISDINGATTFSSNTGVKTFDGLVTISASGSWISTSLTTSANLIFKNGISNSGTSFTASGASFTTNNQILVGSSAYTFSGIITITGVSVTNNSSINVTNGGSGIITGTGTWIQGTNSVLNTNSRTITISNLDASSNVNLVNYKRNNTQTIFPTNYHNLKIDVANTKTLGGNIIVNNDLTVNIASLASSTFTMTVLGNTLVTGNGNINTTNVAGVFNLQGLSLLSSRLIGSVNGTVNMTSFSTSGTGNSIGTGTINNSGTSTIDGITTFSSNSGVKTFTGLVTISPTGSWISTTLTTTSNLIFQNGIHNNGTSFSASGASFNTNNQNLDGTSSYNFSGIVTIAGINLTNNSIVNLTNTGTGIITGSGGWIQGVNSTLNSSATTFTVTTFQASNLENTVNYNRNNTQTIHTSQNGEFYNLRISNTNVKTLSGNISVLGDLSIENTAILSTGSSNPSSFNINIAGDFKILSTATDAFVERNKTLNFNGINPQRFLNNGTALSGTLFNLTINNPQGLFVQGNSNNHIIIQALGTLDLILGKVYTSTSNILILNHTAILSGGSNTSFISGPMRKVGNSTFTFPVGKSGRFAPISISAPALTTDHFTAEYMFEDPDANFPTSSKDITLNSISNCNYWMLNRTNGSSNVSVTLSWNSNNCNIMLLNDLRVTNWNGTQWLNQGNSLVTGNGNSGTVKSSTPVTTFGAYTIGSTTSYEDLPQLISNQCGYSANSLNEYLFSNQISGATQYEFLLENIGLGYSQSHIVNANNIQLTNFSGLSYNSTYTVRIKTFIGGIWGNYGNPCTVSLPNTLQTQLIPAQCGQTLTQINDYIYASEIIGVSQYEFKISNGGSSQNIIKNNRSFNFSELSGIQYGTTYDIEVKVEYNGIWQSFGPICTLTTPSIPTTNIIASQCGTTVANLNTDIYADEVLNATQYRFRATNGVSITIDKPSRTFKFSQMTGILDGTTYALDVAVFINGSWGPFGALCNVSTPSANATQLVATQCGIVISDIFTDLFANNVIGATQYRFRVSNGNGTQTIVKPSRTFKLSQLSNVEYGTINTIDVDVFVGGSWVGYGPICTITTPSAPTSKLLSAQCGITVPSISTYIYANEVPGATQYRFRIDGAQTIVRTSRLFQMSQITGLTINTTYAVDVDAFVAGSWVGYGVTCNLTSPAVLAIAKQDYTLVENELIMLDSIAETLKIKEVREELGFEFLSFPNPFKTDFEINFKSTVEDDIFIQIFDALGKEIESLKIHISDLKNQKFGSEYQSGVYFIHIKQKENKQIFKVLKY